MGVKKVDVSMVLPTYNERENLSLLIERIFKEFRKEKIRGEVIVVDDNSPDGTGELAEVLKKKYKQLQVIHREKKEGLSSAALAGFAAAHAEIVGLMDADGSHPVEKIGAMYRLVRAGNTDIVVGSRYVSGGAIQGWSFGRRWMSRVAVVLARPLTSVKDPMTGYFVMKKSLLTRADLNSRGFKILLEILMVARPKRVVEIPIVFINRKKGKSKAGIGEILVYLQNLLRYYFVRR